jgi:hypothetical protein
MTPQYKIYLVQLKNALASHPVANKGGMKLSPAEAADDEKAVQDKKLQHYDDVDRALTQDQIDQEGHVRTADGDRLTTADTGRDMYVKVQESQTTHSFRDVPESVQKMKEHHSSATEGKEAAGAGRRQVDKGIYRHIDGDSGHYRPTTEDVYNFVAGEKVRGAKMVDDESLSMTGPEGKAVAADAGARAVWAEFQKLETAYQTQRQNRTQKDPPPRSKELLALKQRCEDLGLAPAMTDATVEAIKPTNFFKNDPAGEKAFTTCANDRDEMKKKLLTIFGPQVFPKMQSGKKEDNPNLPYPSKTEDVVDKFMGLTLEQFNDKIGLWMRLRYDVDEFIDDAGEKCVAGEKVQVGEKAAPPKSPARVQLTEQQFVETGGNVKAIDVKDQANKLIGEGRQAPEQDEKEFYEKLGGKKPDGTKKTGDEALEELIAGLKAGNKLPKSWQADGLSIQERTVILSKKRVPPDLLARQLAGDAGKFKEGYQVLGGDKALQERLGVMDPGKFDDEQKFTFLNQGYIPVAHLIDAVGIDEAINRLGGQAKLTELGVSANNTLTSDEKYAVLSNDRLDVLSKDRSALERAFGGEAGIKTRLKALLKAMGLEEDVWGDVPKDERLDALRTKSFTTATLTTIKLMSEVIRKYGHLGAMREKIEERLKTWLKEKGIDDDYAQRLEAMVKDLKARLELANDGTIPAEVVKEANKIAQEASRDEDEPSGPPPETDEDEPSGPPPETDEDEPSGPPPETDDDDKPPREKGQGGGKVEYGSKAEGPPAE